MTRAHLSFWILTILTVLAAGQVAGALARPAGLGTHLVLAGSVLLLAVSATLLARVLRHLTRPTQPSSSPQAPADQAKRAARG